MVLNALEETTGVLQPHKGPSVTSARLPPAEEDGTVARGNGGDEAAHEVLGVDPDAPDAVVRGAARSLKAEHHSNGPHSVGGEGR
jgi:hypothetical protein